MLWGHMFSVIIHLIFEEFSKIDAIIFPISLMEKLKNRRLCNLSKVLFVRPCNNLFLIIACVNKHKTNYKP